MSYVATNCACCGRTLTDETSISYGMGPVCRRGHGFDQIDAEADWGAALGALGAACPSDLYDVIVAAHGVRVGHEEKEIDTTVKDVVKAARALVHRLAVAIQANDTAENVRRYVVALSLLGRRTLARALVRGWMRRRDYRSAFSLTLVDVERVLKPIDLALTGGVVPSDDERETLSFTVRSSYDYQVVDAIRSLPYSLRTYDRETKTWRVEGSAAAALSCALSNVESIDLLASKKSTVTCKVLADDCEPPQEWWDAGIPADDRTCWVNRASGELVRYAIFGEPTHRPGLERVPPQFFNRTLRAVGA